MKHLLLLCVLVISLLILFKFPDQVSSDETVYVKLAEDVYKGEGYKVSYAPGLPFLIYMFFLVLGPTHTAARLVDPVFGFLTVLVLYFFAKTLYNKRVGIVSAIFLLLSPSFLLLSNRILTEIPFLFFFTFSLYTFYLGCEKNRKWLFVFGFLTAITFLVRFFHGLFVIPVCVFYLFIKNKLKIILSKEIFISALIFLITLTPYLYNNYLTYGNPFHSVLESGVNVTLLPQENLPYKIYITQLPSITGILLPFSILGFWTAIKRKNKAGIWLFISLLFLYFVMFLIPVRHIRYVFYTTVMFSIISAYFVCEIKNKKIFWFLLITILLINLIGSIYVFNYFLNYPKHVESKEASLFVEKNCTQPILTNAGAFVNYYTNFEIISSNKENFYKYKDKVSCIVYSYYEGRNEQIENELGTMGKEYKFGTVSVYKLK